MLNDLLKVKHLISIAEVLDPEDYDRLSTLHIHALSEEEDKDVSNKITELYEKYRARGNK